MKLKELLPYICRDVQLIICKQVQRITKDCMYDDYPILFSAKCNSEVFDNYLGLELLSIRHANDGIVIWVK